MTIKKSVSLSTKTTKILSDRSPKDKIVWSKGINQIISAYDHIISTSLPRLTLSEWTVLYDSLKSDLVSQFTLPINLGMSLLSKTGSTDVNKLKKENPKLATLISKLENLTQVEQIAIVDRLKCYESKQMQKHN